MRTHVAKMLVGVGFDTSGATPGAISAGEVGVAPWAAILALLNSGTNLPQDASSDQFGFVKLVKTGVYDVSGPFKTATATVDNNPYDASVQQISTLTVVVTNLTAGKAYPFKVIYHDNLSIIPNQMKNTTVAVVHESGDTDTTYAARIAAAFEAEDFKFVTVTSSSGVVTFTGDILTSASSYNRIDKPELVVFELAAGDNSYDESPAGAFTVAYGTPAVLGQGSTSQIAWLEDQHQGRRGQSDRRMWNNTMKFEPSVIAGTNYRLINVLDNIISEGDMQDTRSYPIGALVCEPSGTNVLTTSLGTIGVTVNTIEHPVDS